MSSPRIQLDPLLPSLDVSQQQECAPVDESVSRSELHGKMSDQKPSMLWLRQAGAGIIQVIHTDGMQASRNE